jgi:hypothetical protein
MDVRRNCWKGSYELDTTKKKRVRNRTKGYKLQWTTKLYLESVADGNYKNEEGNTITVKERTPRCRVFLEKLVVSQLVQKFPDFYGSRKFTAEFTRTSHWMLF